MRYRRSIGFLTVLATFICQQGAPAAITGLTRVASGVSGPMFMTYAPGDTSKLFIAERAGGIRILNLVTGGLEPTPFLTVPGVSTDGEGGLLGLAFHPGYNNPSSPGYRKFYVDITTNSTTQTHIREYQVMANDPKTADASSGREVLSFSQPQTNHKGGWIGFSPNNQYLYIATGDGGGGNDSDTGHTAGTGNAQDITSNLLGKMLRIDPIDPDGDDHPLTYSVPSTNPFFGATIGDDEIWAYGLRNPFRDSFDRLTGNLWIGDVGQGAREEIDFQADNTPGINYGWRLREGKIPTPGVGGTCTGCTDPVYDYARPTGDPTTDLYRGSVVSGGYVYRGPDPSIQGKYFFLDSRNTSGTSDDNYWMFDPANATGTVANINSLLTFNAGSHQFPVSFGEDAFGNLYIAYLVSGDVYRLVTAHIAGDYDYDGDVDNADYNIWRSTVGLASTLAPADGNGNGVVDAADYTIWRKNAGKSLGSGAGAAVPEAGVFLYLVQLASVLAIRPSFARRRKSTKMMSRLT